MNNPEFKLDDLEILISTMNRNSLDFLVKIFKNNELSKYAILIINQTKEGNELISTSKNIRVINTQERGLPQSRNMAIKNAKRKLCLIADDDVVYEPGFEKHIISAYNKHKAASVITFEMLNERRELYQDYAARGFLHTDKSIVKVNGVVISFKLENLKAHGISYNNHFGIGATFECANEYVFMKNVLKANVKAYFEPSVLLVHPNYSTGSFGGDDKVIKARSAFHYKYFGWLAYPWVIRYIWFMYLKQSIPFNKLIYKLKVGFKGIAQYRKLVKEGLEKRN